MRQPWLIVAAVALSLFGLVVVLVLANATLPADLAVERAVQGVDWGPLQSLFRVLDHFEGREQLYAAGAVLLLILVVRLKAFLLGLWAALTGPMYAVLELQIQRPRPSGSLVHVIRHTSGISFPSGHVLLFTWVLWLLALVFSARLARPVRIAAWALAGLALGVVCLSRVYTAEHWPSDVLGSLLLGIGWVSLGLSVRRLSAAVLDS